MAFGDSPFNTDSDLMSPKRGPRQATGTSSVFDPISGMMKGTPMEGMSPSSLGSGPMPSGPSAPSTSAAPPMPQASGFGAPPVSSGVLASPGEGAGVGGNPYAKPGNTSSKNLQNIMAQLFNQDVGTHNNLLNENENALNFDNIPSTPLYHANLTGANEATSSAYDQAIANARASASQRGFGESQPIEQGNETQLRGQEASTMARNPSHALLETVQPILQAAGIRTSEMAQYNPDQIMTIWADLVNKKNAASAGLMSGIAGAYGQIGSSAITAASNNGP